MIKAPKKLIEVAMPLDDINEAAAREKSIRHGHPSTLHLWWARRPLAAARAVLFAQLVNDPGGERGWGKYPGQTKEDAQKERERLFSLLRELVKWENSCNEELLAIAREEIRKSWKETCELNKGKQGFDPGELPAFHDPFAGGGAIPFEAQRLGLEAYASDLNPVAVMINKCMIEIPPKFSGKAPVGPIPTGDQGDTRGKDGWTGAKGLAEDIRRYGHWLNDKAEEKIGFLYPKVEITSEIANGRAQLEELIGEKLPVVAWIWSRTVNSPNPAYSDIEIPLANSFILCSKKEKYASVKPVFDSNKRKIKYIVDGEKGQWDEGNVSRKGAFCVISNAPFPLKYIREKGKSRGLGKVLIAIVVQSSKGRVYVSGSEYVQNLEDENTPIWSPMQPIAEISRDIKTQTYGMDNFDDIFTNRQLIALDTFSTLIQDVHPVILNDCLRTGMENNGVRLSEGGTGAVAYADAVCTYLALAVDRSADYWSTLCSWHNSKELIRNTFSRQALPMSWDFAEGNPFSSSAGNFIGAITWIEKVVRMIRPEKLGVATQADASTQEISKAKIISTDPPYYDNICYAALSDFFYVWLRRSLKDVYPNEFMSISTPKDEELISNPSLRGGKEEAYLFFMNGMKLFFKNIKENYNNSFPITIYYALKQSETDGDSGTMSIGWETFLTALIDEDFIITGTWPMRTELASRTMSISKNALASSIILVCRTREIENLTISKREFLRLLKDELPDALEAMIGGKDGSSPIAPVDLAQAAIGPGMAVFSRYSGIIEADGSKMSVHSALIQINKVVDEYFNEAEGDMDSDTRFCIDWFMQFGFKKSEYGQAHVLARAKGTTVEGLALAGVVETGGGHVRLLKIEEYPESWDPKNDVRMPVWEALHQLIRALRSGGEEKAGFLLKEMSEKTASIRQLAYRLYTLCERKGWAEEARVYNELISSWHATIESAENVQNKRQQPQQLKFEI